MNFQEALNDIIKNMAVDAEEYKECNNLDSNYARVKLEGHIRQLKMLSILSQTPFIDQNVINVVQKAQERASRKENLIEDRSERMLMCKGGPADGCLFGVSANVKVGMKAPIAGGVYQLQQDKETNTTFLQHLEEKKE